MEFKHLPILRDEIINLLNINPNGVYVDCTVGGAGHSSAICEKLNDNATLICFDKDLEALSVSKQRLEKYSCKKIFIHSDFHSFKEKSSTLSDAALFDQKLLDDFAHLARLAARSIGLVGVDVHRQRIGIVHANDNIAKDQAAAIGLDLNGNDLLVDEAELGSVSSGHVDVALGNDNALGDFDLALRANDLAGAGALHLAGLTNRSHNADGAGVGQGQLNLGLRTDRTEDGHAGQGLLRAHDVDALSASILTRLGQHLLDGQLIAFAKENIKMLTGNMNVTGGSFHQNLIRHWNTLLIS